MKSQNTQLQIAICIATFKRTELLNSLFESLKSIELPKNADVAVRVVDNDFQSSARPVVDAFCKSQKMFFQVSYQTQPERNIALTRNVAIDSGPADMFVFVDDDETVDQQWLIELVKTAKNHSADAVFGSVKGKLEKATLPKHRWLQTCGQFDKQAPCTGTILSWKATRTSNTLVMGKWFYGEHSLRFNRVFGRSGGSDTELFARMEVLGAKLVSSAGSIVFEIVPENRATFAWLIRRYYRNGLIFERIVSSHDSNWSFPKGFVRFFKRLIGAGLLIAGSGFSKNKIQTLVQGLLKVPLALGGLLFCLTPHGARQFDAYAPRSERALKRVAFLTNIISPYRKPVFENLSKTSGWNFRVFVDAKNEFDRKWNVSSKVLKVKRNFTISVRRKVVSKSPVPFNQVITLHIPVGLFFSLLKFNPAVVVSHELGIRTLIAAAYTSVFRKELVIWAYQSKISSLQGGWREGFRRFLLKRADRVVGMGKQARAVLLGWGVPDYKIIDAPNAADHNSLERSLRAAVATQEIRAIQSQVGNGRKIALVAGRLVALKGIDQLLSIWEKLPDYLTDQWSLVFVGEGPLKALRYKTTARNVKWVGHVPTYKMAYWYSAADLHVFASNGDVWGLAVNEASICGTPTLCSVHAGCYDDLVKPGENGFKIDFSNPETAVSELKAALAHQNLQQLGAQAREDIKRYSVDRLASSFRKAVTLATA